MNTPRYSTMALKIYFVVFALSFLTQFAELKDLNEDGTLTVQMSVDEDRSALPELYETLLSHLQHKRQAEDVDQTDAADKPHSRTKRSTCSCTCSGNGAGGGGSSDGQSRQKACNRGKPCPRGRGRDWMCRCPSG